VNNLKGILLSTILVTSSAIAETDNFNVSLTGTFDNTNPDACTVTPISAINLGTISMYDLVDGGTATIPMTLTVL